MDTSLLMTVLNKEGGGEGSVRHNSKCDLSFTTIYRNLLHKRYITKEIKNLTQQKIEPNAIAHL
jgi:hypothetical protein